MDYTPIRITTIIPTKTLSFELYIFFKEKFLKYVENGESITDDKLGKLKKQNIARFYIKAADEDNYQQFLDEILEASIADPNVETEQKVNLVDGACKNALERMKEDPGSERSVKLTKKAANSLRKLISNDKETLKNMYGKTASKDELLMQHCLNVSGLAVSLAQHHNASEEVQDMVALAGLLHDIGLTKLDDDIQKLFHENIQSLSDQDRELYEKHPQMAVDILKDNPNIDEKILDLIIHHEEKLTGEGYPHHKTQLTFEQEILALANCYDKRVTILKQDPKEALRSLQLEELGSYSQSLIDIFKKHLKEKGIT